MFTGKYKTIISNFSYLSVLQILNMLLPIVTYPYLLSVLGGNLYGQIVYSQAIISYLVILVNFGFNITATKEISVNRDNHVVVDRIVGSVYQLKGLFCLISFIILCLYLWLLKADLDTAMLYGLTFWMCIYEFLFPIWYFQGTEKMRFVTILTVLSRLVFLGLIFILIKAPSDYLLVPLINGIGALISALLAIRIVFRQGVNFRIQNPRILRYYLKSSYVMAIAYGANTFKTSFNIVIIKHFFSYSVVAYFDLAMKVINIGIAFLDLISQAIYPTMSKFKDPKLLQKIMKISLVLSILGTLLIQILAGTVVKVLGDDTMDEAVVLLKVLSLIFPIYITGALLGRNCLIVHDQQGEVLKSMIYSSIVYLAIIYVAFYHLSFNQSIWVAFAYILSYLFETGFRYYKSKQLNLV